MARGFGDRRRIDVPSWWRFLLILGLIFTVRVRDTHGWHGIGNQPFHCWPLDAGPSKPTPFSTCPGIDIEWLVEPPDEIKAEVGFNVSYHLSVNQQFYEWAVNKSIFDDAGNNGGFSHNATAARTWCETTVCPTDVTQAGQDNCCVHHVNVHSCPLAQTSVVANGLCGPWIPPSGSIFTHSDVLVGPITRENWTSSVSGLYEVGLTSMIAHFKLAGMHIAVEKEVNVLPKTVCGDGLCETSDDETCDNCPKDCGSCPLKTHEVALIVISILLVIGAILAVFGYVQYQRRKLLWDESWIVPADAIHEASGDGGQFGSQLSISVGSSCADVNSVISNSMASAAIKRQLFATVAYVDGRQVAVRKIHNKQFTLSKVIRVEVRDVRSLEHPNLCRFMGGCVEVGSVCILYEYCPKGSLMDVLQNDSIPLNWAFRFSLVTDVARGMAHLHKHKMIHGNLKANNCVVDDRWTCKVTDFGLTEYRRQDMESDSDLQQERIRKERRDQVYRAPETRSKSQLLVPASDVYSFAIILVEVATSDDVYGEEDCNTLPEGWKPPLPHYTQDNAKVDPDLLCPAPHEYSKLILQCWSDKIEERPNFEHVKKTLQRINPNKMSPVDTMMAIMEKYSKHLESVVNERTQQLLEEKQRTDTLLYSMMPREVADLLKTGQQVQAEQFESCTIYFSDIVGFTTLSGQSTAMQVVQLLNHLYTTFDSIIEQYDVYKVETIGDAYMVVSGVPNRTAEHARHVAMMSLDMVQASRKFQIPHMPHEPLRIRVGLHSGSVCAGVVGIKMPRYCLFGDTVNTASRMESNGEAYKIHISDTTFMELQKLGHFVCEPRGSIPVKGKGDMFTWWLIKAEESPCEKTTSSTEGSPQMVKEKDSKELDMDTVIEEIILNSDIKHNMDDLHSLLQ